MLCEKSNRAIIGEGFGLCHYIVCEPPRVSVSDRGRNGGERLPNFFLGSTQKKRVFMMRLSHKKNPPNKNFPRIIFRIFLKSSQNPFKSYQILSNPVKFIRILFISCSSRVRPPDNLLQAAREGRIPRTGDSNLHQIGNEVPPES